MSESTGWPGGEFETYNQHANVKLTQEQLDHIINSGEPISQWIRQAIQNRINDETNGDASPRKARWTATLGEVAKLDGDVISGLRSDGEWPK